jgi:hypothetical protein
MLSERLTKLLTAYVDGELDARRREAVLSQAQKSPEAREFLRQLQEDANRLRQLPILRPTQDLAQKIAQRLAEPVVLPLRVTVPKVVSPFPRGYGLATAAAVLLAMGVGAWYYLTAVRDVNRPTAAEQDGNRFAVKTDGPAESPKSAAAKQPEQPEIGAVAEKKAKSAPAPWDLVRPADDRLAKSSELPPSPRRDEGPLASPDRKEDHFTPIPYRVAVFMPTRELTQRNRQEELTDKLRRAGAQHLDLYCQQTTTALDRLQGAFRDQGIQSVMTPDAENAHKLGLKTDYLLYGENVTPDDVVAVLRRIAIDERKAETGRRGAKQPGQFQNVLVDGISPDDYRLLKRVLDVDLSKPDGGQRNTQSGIDPLKPLAARTADEVVRSLKGHGTPRPEPGKSMSKAPERLLVVSTCNPIHPDPKVPQVQRFRNSLKERLPGSMQVLVVLRGGSK